MPQKVVVVGAGPVGSLAALYAAVRGHEVEIYELRPGKLASSFKNFILTTTRSERPRYNTTQFCQVHQLGSLRARHQLPPEDWPFRTRRCCS